MDESSRMKRLFDIVFGSLVMLLILAPTALVALLVRLTSPGPIIYWSDRVGRDNRIFRMPKFRTMRIDTPEVAAHLLTDPKRWMTPIGAFLRSTSLDELPQVWSILRGDMSFVGPRPALFNQYDLIAERTRHGVHELVPGLTGWAQINGRDELTIIDKTAYDLWYAEHKSFRLDLRIIALTAFKAIHSTDRKTARA
jgi:O-antigen biosynthesis protein WbqP